MLVKYKKKLKPPPCNFCQQHVNHRTDANCHFKGNLSVPLETTGNHNIDKPRYTCSTEKSFNFSILYKKMEWKLDPRYLHLHLSLAIKSNDVLIDRNQIMLPTPNQWRNKPVSSL